MKAFTMSQRFKTNKLSFRAYEVFHNATTDTEISYAYKNTVTM